MKRLALVLMMVAVVGVADAGVVGKDGSTVADSVNPPQNIPSSRQAAWEWSSGGVMDFVPTTGGSFDGWGSHFLATTVNGTGQDMQLTELGIPCAGTIAAEWMVWIGTMPSDYSSPDFSGSFMATDPDPLTFPPTVYTYVDVTSANVLVPSGEAVWIAYVNPGVGGQTDFNGVDTWSWYLGAWDGDQAWGRTAIMQLKGDPVVQPTPTVPPSTGAEPVPTMSLGGIAILMTLLAGIAVAILARRR